MNCVHFRFIGVFRFETSECISLMWVLCRFDYDFFIACIKILIRTLNSFFFPLHSYFFQENSQSSDQPPKPPRLPLKEVNTVSLTVRPYGALIKNRLGASSNLAYRSMLPKLELLRGIHLVRAVGLGRDSTHLVIGGCL